MINRCTTTRTVRGKKPVLRRCADCLSGWYAPTVELQDRY